MSAQLIIKHNSDFADSLEKVKKKKSICIYLQSSKELSAAKGRK